MKILLIITIILSHSRLCSCVFLRKHGDAKFQLENLPINVNNIYSFAGGGSVSGTSADGGPATSAILGKVYNIAPDSSRGKVYILDTGNKNIRVVDTTTNIINTVSLGTTTLSGPYDIQLDSNGDLVIADTAAGVIRRVVYPFTGTVTTVAGTAAVSGSTGDGGPATSALLNSPYGCGLDTSSNIYIADTFNFKIRFVKATTGYISTIATAISGGNGPVGVSVDSVNKIAYVAEGTQNAIQSIDTTTLAISTLVTGLNNPWRVTIARYKAPYFLLPLIEIDNLSFYSSSSFQIEHTSTGNIFFTDSDSNYIKFMIYGSSTVYTVVGNGVQGSSGDGGKHIFSTHPALSAPPNHPFSQRNLLRPQSTPHHQPLSHPLNPLPP